MKLCRFDDDRLGVVIGDNVHDVTAAQSEIRASTPFTAKVDPVVAALPAWRARLEQMAASAPGRPISQVKLLSPVARPPKILAAPTNYAKHVQEMQHFRDTIPGLARFSPDIEKAGIFLKSNTSLVGPSEGIPMRFPDRRNDHEVELVLVIGKEGSDIPRERAYQHVAGYCLGLDMTARGQEDRSFRKSIDGYTVLGPWMITADEIENPADLPLTLRVNDEKRQDSNTNLIFDIPRLIEFASQFYTLYPGDLYYTGTPEGVGPVKPGDWISCRSVPALGELRIQVRAHEAQGSR
jgi:2-keto-4-pentenoate hydratase/2-oxohepta-3-ene-1,7-dioic acid hydratase in catechol pathway